MPQFDLTASVAVSASTQVEADTLEEAIRIAEGRDVQLGFNGSGNSSKDVWLIEDADGSPFDVCES